jgi:hypothetical protein
VRLHLTRLLGEKDRQKSHAEQCNSHSPSAAEASNTSLSNSMQFGPAEVVPKVVADDVEVVSEDGRAKSTSRFLTCGEEG